jgi:hypothetical protein
MTGSDRVSLVFAYSRTADSANAGYIVATERFLCLLGGGATAPVAGELYRHIDAEGAALEHVFDFVEAHEELKHFAVVESVDSALRNYRVAVRGSVVVDVEGAAATRLAAMTPASWITSEVRGVTSLALSVDADSAAGALLPLRSGVVVSNSVRVTATEDGSPLLQGDVQLRTRQLPLPRLGEEVAVEDAAPSVWHLAFPDSSELDVTRPVIIGRRPWAVGGDERSVVRLVAPSPLCEISATHLELSLVDGQLNARDLQSTNGTVIYGPSRAPRLLNSGRAVALLSGDILDLGESFTIAVSMRP